MDEIEREFMADVRTKKNVAASAKHRKGTVFGPKGCRLPSDNMTKKERNKMNGEIITYELNKPVTFEAFKKWPLDIMKEYLTKLQTEFNATDTVIAEMMGTTVNTIAKYRRFSAVMSLSRGARVNKEKWERFLHGEPEPAVIAETHLIDNPIVVSNDIHPRKIEIPATFNVNNFSVSLNASNWDIVFGLLSHIDISSGRTITVQIE